jgi:hypothetical protein
MLNGVKHLAEPHSTINESSLRCNEMLHISLKLRDNSFINEADTDACFVTELAVERQDLLVIDGRLSDIALRCCDLPEKLKCMRAAPMVAYLVE